MARLPKCASMVGISIAVLMIIVIYLDLFRDVNDKIPSNEWLLDKIKSIQRNQQVIVFKSQETIDQEIVAQLEPKKEMPANETQFTIRDWFDSRPQSNSSTKSFLGHPLFQGFMIENSNICKDHPVDILIYVQSTPDHHARRNLIRSTWGNERLFHNISVRTIFVLGLPTDREYQLEIDIEQSAHGDIIQGKINDTFVDMGYKAITSMVWINKHCPQAKVIVKADDDVFVDIFQIVKEFIPLMSTRQRSVVCDYLVDLKITRNPKSRWNLPNKFLPNVKTYPPFCSGYFVLFTGDLVPMIYEASFHTEKFVPLDDAYIFGILTDGLANVNVTNVHDHISYLPRPDPFQELKVNGRFELLAFGVPKKVKELWDKKLQLLSAWEREQSLFEFLFHSGKKSVVID